MSKKRILVVDDEHMSRAGVAEVLTDEGYDVREAADGQDAVAVLDSFHPDLVLTTLQMPQVNGIEVLSHVQQVCPTTPVLIFTASLLLDAQRDAQRLGVQGYLNKPLDFDLLLSQVATALASHPQ